jgi:hypothetical protein
MTGDGKQTTNALVQTYPERENPEYQQEEAESRQNIPQSLNMMENI